LKIFRPNCEAVIHTLDKVFNCGEHLGKTLDRVLHTNKKIGAKDRSFIAETVFNIVRFKRFFASVSNQEYDFLPLNCNKLLAAYLSHNNVHLPEWFPIETDDITSIKEKANSISEEKIKLSYTDWFWEYGVSEFKQNWISIAQQLNLPAEVFIRVNTKKTDCNTLQAKLKADGIETETIPLHDNALKIIGRHKLTNHQTFNSGEFEFQDISSQEVVRFCECTNDKKIADICAGAGGKSLYLSELTQPNAEIFSFDIYEQKLAALNIRAQKAGVKNIRTFLENDSMKTELQDKMDLVLVDAPCSGSGVIRRNPENKWNLTEEKINAISKLQTKILNDSSTLVKPFGRLVYATCSIIKHENENIVSNFLSANKNFRLVEEKKLVPGLSTNSDGFYMAKLERIKQD